MAPALVLILALTVYPLIYSVWVAFVNFDFQIPGHAFVGLQNFEHVVEDPVARWSLVTTAILSVSSVVLEFLLGLGLSGPQVVEGWHGEAYGKPLMKSREYVEMWLANLSAAGETLREVWGRA